MERLDSGKEKEQEVYGSGCGGRGQRRTAKALSMSSCLVLRHSSSFFQHRLSVASLTLTHLIILSPPLFLFIIKKKMLLELVRSESSPLLSFYQLHHPLVELGPFPLSPFLLTLFPRSVCPSHLISDGDRHLF